MTSSAPTPVVRSGRLSAQDWTQAALDLVAEQGVAAVAVLVLWANRPLNVFLIVFTVVNAALVLLLATLLWRTEPVPER